jgi:large subunit ribosomal protein L24e
MKCIFCSKLQQPGQGIILALNDGRVLYFCSSKCRRNFKLRRDPKKIKWARPKTPAQIRNEKYHANLAKKEAEKQAEKQVEEKAKS